MKLLIAFDASKYSQDILGDLKRAGLPKNMEAVVLSIADVLMPPGYGLAGSKIPKSILPRVRSIRAGVVKATDDALKIAQGGAKSVREEFPGSKVHAQSRGDSPASAILQKAGEWKPDLIVVGSRGRGTFSHLSIGSVAQRVLQQAKCSVRVSRVNPHITASRPVRVIVGLDGSPHSKKALKKVLLRHRKANVEIRLVAAIERSYEDKRQQGIAKRHLEEATRRLRTDGFLVSPVAKKGYPADVLIDEAKQWKADCIFLGARGLSSGQRLFLGSVSAVIAAHAPCSVEIVK